MSTQQVDLNRPVANLAASRSFCADLGFDVSPRFSDDTVARAVAAGGSAPGEGQ